MDIRAELEKLQEDLEQHRDELKVKMGLAKLEVRDEWESAEQQLEQLLSKKTAIISEAHEISEDVLETMKQMGREIKSLFDRVGKRLG